MYRKRMPFLVTGIAIVLVLLVALAVAPVGRADEHGACGDPATLIHEVQGDGAITPLLGQTVVVEAIVVGDFQEPDELEAFFVQEERDDWDDDIETSEGLYIDDEGFGVDVAVGDVVRVQGEADEAGGMTQLTNISAVTICSSGADVEPVDVNMPVVMLDRWEWREGMLVVIDQTLVVTDNYNQGRFGEVSLAVGERLFIPTNRTVPGAPARVLQAVNDVSRILLDDGSNEQNPVPPPYFEEGGTLRAGDTLDELVGVVAYGFGSYRIHPTEEVDFERVNERTAAPDVEGELLVTAFNVLNYFTTIDEGEDICGPTGGLECRGADTPEEFERQRTKIISALSIIDADVVGLMEIENNEQESVANLVAGLNDEMGAGTYDFIDTGTIGTDAIKVALIYKPDVVSPVGDFAILDSSVDPEFLDEKNRPVLIQTFEEDATGEVFTVAVNHLKSKGSPCDDVGDPAEDDGQGNCNTVRTLAARALAQYLETDPTNSNDPDFMIIGDLNAYANEDPISALKALGYRDLIQVFVPPQDAYSYVFFGEAGYLDHSLANGPMFQQVVDTAIWHINADEPNALNYNNFNQEVLFDPGPYRSSDHDPVIVGLNLGGGEDEEDPDEVRFATYNASLNRFNQGELIDDLTFTNDQQAQKVAEIIQRTRPDVLLINEFDYDPAGRAAMLFQRNYLSLPQDGAEAIYYPYRYVAPSNTGIPSGFDLNNDGEVGGPDDAFGFGFFPGQYGMAVYSMYPIDTVDVRTFQTFLWKDMPGNLIPEDWYSEEELEVFRLSSKSHWDLPIVIDGEVIHFLTAHPTPPVFDGPEDRNGRRNFDEIRFWADYIDPDAGSYIYDDDGETGGLPADAQFVIAGDYNADPFDGDSLDEAARQFTENPLINNRVIPSSEGAVEASEEQGLVNELHEGNPAYDTADFYDGEPGNLEGAAGNLRVDYVLPSDDLRILESAVFWPTSDAPYYDLIDASDHRLVWVDIGFGEVIYLPIIFAQYGE